MPHRLLNLRPTFYRTRGSDIIYSGWQANTTGAIYTLGADGQTIEMVPLAKECLCFGERVTFARSVDLHPVDYIEGKERGIVAHVDGETGVRRIKMELYHCGLGDNNELTLMPHADEEVIAALAGRRKVFKSVGHLSDTSVNILCALSSLLLTVPASMGIRFMTPEAHPTLLFMGGVAWASCAYGTRAATVLALATPLAYNLTIMDPVGQLGPVRAYEFFAAALYVGVAVGFPWAVKRGASLLKRLMGAVTAH